MKRIIAIIISIAATLGFSGVAVARAATSPTSCTSPKKLKGKEGTLHYGDYLVQQDQWSGEGHQTMLVCSESDWTATVKQHGKPETGVKTYPDSDKTYTNWSDCSSQPALSSFATLTSTYGEVAPVSTRSSWDYAYDIFINGGVCHKPLTELMIWNQWQDISLPNAQLHPTIDGVAYDIYHSGGYIQMRQVTQTTSGSVNLLPVFSYLESQGLLSAADTLQFIQYGVEVLTTYHQPIDFSVNAFSVTDK